MGCEYCEEDKDGYVKFLPKSLKGFNASIHKGSMNEVKLHISGAGQKGSFNIKSDTPIYIKGNTEEETEEINIVAEFLKEKIITRYLF